MIRRPSAPNPTNDPKLQRAAAAVLYAALVLLALWIVREFLPAVAWACVIAIVLWPAYRAIEASRALRGRTTVIATVLTIAVALLVVLPVAMTITRAAGEAHDLLQWLRAAQQNGVPVPGFVEHLPFGSRQVTDWWQANLGEPLNTSKIKGLHSEAVMSFGRQFGVRAVHATVLFGFMLITLFMILQAGPRLSGTVLTGVRRAFGPDGAQLVQRMASAVRGTVTGLVIVGIGEGLLLGVAYVVAGVPHAALLGSVTAVAAMLPFCAPIVFCGAALWLLLQGDVAWAVAVVVWGFVIVFVAEHFVRPVLIGNSTRLPFLLVLFGILGGATTFGLLGIFIGPALMTVLMVMWTDWTD